MCKTRKTRLRRRAVFVVAVALIAMICVVAMTKQMHSYVATTMQVEESYKGIQVVNDQVAVLYQVDPAKIAMNVADFQFKKITSDMTEVDKRLLCDSYKERNSALVETVVNNAFTVRSVTSKLPSLVKPFRQAVFSERRSDAGLLLVA